MNKHIFMRLALRFWLSLKQQRNRSFGKRLPLLAVPFAYWVLGFEKAQKRGCLNEVF